MQTIVATIEAAEDHALAGLRMGCELDLDPFAEVAPAVRPSKLGGELPDFGAPMM